MHAWGGRLGGTRGVYLICVFIYVRACTQVIAACSTEAGAASYDTSKGGITAVKMDMSDEAEVKAVAAQLARAHPEGLYCLVNNNNNTGEIGKGIRQSIGHVC